MKYSEQLLPVVLEVGEVNLKCMELLDKANTTSYGTPAPVKVSLSVEPGPFIVVTGHDLKDLHMLLEQDRKSTRLNSSHRSQSRMPSSA